MNAMPPERPVQHKIIDRFTVIAVVLTVVSLGLYLVKITEVASLPSHPLFVHAPIVLVPLAAIFGTVCAWVPTWRRRYLPAIILVAIAGLAGAILAVNAGDALRDAMNGGSQLVAEHAEAGEKVPWAALALVVALVGLRLANRYRAVGKYNWAVPAFAVITTLVSIFGTAAVVYAGHLGSESVWKGESDRPAASQNSGFSDDD